MLDVGETPGAPADRFRSASTVRPDESGRATAARVWPPPVGYSDRTTTNADRPPVMVRHERLADHGFGESFLVWRCGRCGEVGDLESFPSACPACAAGREELYYDVED